MLLQQILFYREIGLSLNEFILSIERIMTGLIQQIDKNANVSDEAVQELMKMHYEWLVLNWTPTKEQYMELTNLYQAKGFREFYGKRDPRLLAFMVAAMKV